jgi:dihydroorotate dehydrogenase
VIYRLIFNLVFKPMNPEFAHHLVVFGLRLLSKIGILRAPKSHSKVSVLGLDFENRFGMAAGFDKNAELILPLYALGFSHVEIGTVTKRSQPGNPKPRMFRLPASNALINRMGFNNEGAELIARRLRKLRSGKARLPIIGVNIGKNKDTSAADAPEDYRYCTELLAPLADYLVVNVSSPNTPGLRDLQQVESLRPILAAVLSASGAKPVLVKIAPDLSDEDIVSVCGLVNELDLAGVVATNTTISREAVTGQPNSDQAGGLSGAVLYPRSLEVVKLVRKELLEQKVVIGVGGVSTREDFQGMLEAGADLVQAYTGFVYGGPFWPRKITS